MAAKRPGGDVEGRPEIESCDNLGQEQHRSIVLRHRCAEGVRVRALSSFRAVPNAKLILKTFETGSETLSVRIGIDAGDPIEGHSDLFGSTVQIAARLCSEAEANGIIVSGFARELCDEDAAQFVALGDRRLKGFADKAQVFRFEWRN